ncbi:MAG: adenosylmethionine decarboxylase [Ponticaulis sp.]|nr:adenosylmethionine decarboxylase [Ponticaulis sp.]MAT34594.1 adenosylmethionine decarboxylase [Ponticaulis sp.]|tara:strand:- start:9770 stop:10243 length:474 start_codon:yes stop_codon:yes gene_type:complete
MAYGAPGHPDFEVLDEQGKAASEQQSDAADTEERLDFFIKRDGVEFAGTHLIIDLWDVNRIDDPEHIERSLCDAAVRAGATILSSDFHVFTPNNGVSGVIVLSESHISIHTWPERNFAAVDVFMCGAAQPHRTIEALREAFSPSRIGLTEHRRGLSV